MKETGKISYLEMPSRDIKVTKQFFSEVFDWAFVDYGPEYVTIDNAGLEMVAFLNRTKWQTP